MKETQRNIKNYKRKLVGLKEKLATAGLLFLMSAVMLTTASFAWITLSLNPEIKGIESTISGNGNLEIALAHTGEDGVLREPAASQVGDSNLQIVEKNITWGNLVNLSDASYGMDRIVLKPAKLNNPADIPINPLLSVIYSKDGRVVAEEDDFKYTSFNSALNSNLGGFEVSDPTRYGVRAVSSVHSTTDNTLVVQAYDRMREIKKETGEFYLQTIEKHKETLSEIIGIFVSDKARATSLGDKVKADYRPNIPAIIDFMNDFLASIEEAYKMYDFIARSQYTGDASNFPYSNIDQMVALGEAKLKDKIPSLKGLDKLIAMHKKIASNIVSLETKKNDKTTYPVLNWEHISSEVNYIVTVNTCMINGKYEVGKISASMAPSMLGEIKKGNNTGEIKSGAIVDFENIIGSKIDIDVTIKSYLKPVTGASLLISLDKNGYAHIEARVFTASGAPFDIDEAINGAISEMNKGKPIIYEADDVYGLVLDFWVRTNVSDSYLLLEGKTDARYSVRTTSEGCACYEDPKGTIYYYKPAEGCRVNEFANVDPTIQTPNTSQLLNGDFYYYSTNQKIVFDEIAEEVPEDFDPSTAFTRENFLPTLVYSQNVQVVGYDGVNRVWQTDTDMIDADSSTTQGKGSCFVFYPSDPIEQEKMLELLDSFYVAFVDSESRLLSTAKLNSKMAYEEGGKITVPLELISGSIVSNEENASSSFAVTKLELNEPTLITAIAYINGEEIENYDVSAASSINGSLNIQFGSNVLLNSMRDDQLEIQTIDISGGIRKSGTSDEFSQSIDYGENPDFPVSADVKLIISGIDAGEVHASFVRSVNNFQGVMMEEIEFVKQDSTEWTGSYTFTSPGTYVMSRIWVDGIEYKLDTSLSADVGEYSVGGITWNQSDNEVYHMTSDNSYSVTLGVDISASANYTPKSAKALFRNEDNEYLTINLTPGAAGIWNGSGTFTTSGRYVLEYILIDDDMYCYVPEAQQKIVNLYLGLYASVDLAEEQIEWKSDETADENNIVSINKVCIYDNKDKKVDKMNDAVLRYGLSGSDNYLEADLIWDPEKEQYYGEFNVLYPGVYSFNRVRIGNSNNITKAEAETLTAIPPYSPAAVSNSLVSVPYRFAPNNDGGFNISISDSSTARVVAEVEYTHPVSGKTESKYIPAVMASTDSETRVTKWNIIPFVNEQTKVQDGIWELKNLYLTDVYFNNSWQSASGDEWWSSDTGVIQWDANLFTNNSSLLKTDILNDIHVMVYAAPSTPDGLYVADSDEYAITYSSDFTNSLDNEFYISGFDIVYTDSFGRSLDYEKYDLTVTNSMNYIYSANTETNEVGTNGWLTEVNGDDKYLSTWSLEISNQIIDFVDDETSVVYLKYPGLYSPSLNLSVVSNGKTYTNKTGSNYSDCFKITSTLNYAAVKWNRPDMKFTGVSPAGEIKTKNSAGKAETVTNSYSERSFTVYMEYTEKTNCSSEKNTPSQVSAQIENYGKATSATAAGYNNSEKKFEFKFTNGKAPLTDIGSASGANKNPIGKATIEHVVITYNNQQYTFKLPIVLTANGEY